MSPAGFPHSEICGSRAICASPQLIAAYHVLHRLLTPRHPPCALSSLTEHLGARWLSLLLPVVRIQLSKTAARFGESCRRRELQIYRTEVWPPFRRTYSGSRLVEIAGIEPATSGLQSRRSPN
jgi:hypothetical protein